MGPLYKSRSLEMPLVAQIRKPLSTIPGKKSRLSHVGVRTEVVCDLPSSLLTILHALTVLTVKGLLQTAFRDLRF